MAITYDALKAFPFEDREHAYTTKDAMLYALGIGLGFEPTDTRQLRFVVEKDLEVFPTMGVVLALAKPWLHRPEAGVTWSKMLHGEQELVIHRPLKPEGVVFGETRMEEIVDKGAGKGALLYMSRTVKDKATGDAVFTAKQTLFCRADGGFGGKVTEARPVHALPERKADHVVDIPTMPQSALLYRLNGDVNPLHADPAVATAAGFERPILHGLCSFGIAGHAVLRTVADYRASALRSIKARFSSPVYPGETIRTEIWDEGKGRFGFLCRVVERDLIVINNGLAEIA